MTTVTRFTSKTCAPCKAFWPVFAELQREFGWKATFSTVDIDENPEYASSNNILGVPAVIIHQNGVEIHRILGLKSKSVYVSILQSV